jgi:hypothetical protein
MATDRPEFSFPSPEGDLLGTWETEVPRDDGPDFDLESSGVEAIFAFVTHLYNENAIMLKKIEGKRTHDVKFFEYTAPPTIADDGSECKLKLTEEQMSDSVGDVVDDWRGEVNLLRPFDIFNLKVDYECKSLADISRLNTALFDVAQRYNMFYDDDSKKGKKGEPTSCILADIAGKPTYSCVRRAHNLRA